MRRQDKGRAVARYITGSTGIPGCAWDGGHSSILMPYPYKIDVTTSKKLQHWHDLIRSYPDESPNINACIRFDAGIDVVSGAWVGLPLGQFSRLLAAHYESITAGTERQ
jgi:hypothetical protein